MWVRRLISPIRDIVQLAHGSVIPPATAESGEHLGEILRADVEMLANPPPQHGRGDVAAAAFFLCLVQHPEHHTLLAGESIAHVGQKVPLVLQGLNSVFSFFFTATPLMVAYTGRPFL